MSKIDEKVSELMLTKQTELPAKAFDYLKKLSNKIGFCGETCVTAFYDYCQLELKMRCKKDSQYKVTKDRKELYK